MFILPLLFLIKLPGKDVNNDDSETQTPIQQELLAL